MNDNEFNDVNNDLGNGTYHATTNLNTAIENPKINMNSAVGVNIEDVQSSNYVASNLITSNDNANLDVNSQFNHQTFTGESSNSVEISNSSDSEQSASNFIPTGGNNHVDSVDRVVYEPTMEENKRHEKFTISREIKILMFIVAILFVFLLLMPYIYDFFQKLSLGIANSKNS